MMASHDDLEDLQAKVDSLKSENEILLEALKAIMEEYEGLAMAIPPLKNSEARKSALATIAKAGGRES